jgi:hypothetical protein
MEIWFSLVSDATFWGGSGYWGTDASLKLLRPLSTEPADVIALTWNRNVFEVSSAVNWSTVVWLT